MKIFITGSTTGLGLLAGQILLKEGHEVVFHARNKNSEQKEKASYVYGDLSKLSEVKSIAEQVNALGPFDSIIHNAGVYQASADDLFSVNVLAPYVLSKLITRPKRMIFLSSGMHLGGSVNIDGIKQLSYSDSKLYDLMLAKYFARKWEGTFINAVDPGWVPTRMGGAGATDDLMEGAETQSWLAVSNDLEALVSGKYFHHKKQHKSNPQVDSIEAQDELVKYLKAVSVI